MYSRVGGGSDTTLKVFLCSVGGGKLAYVLHAVEEINSTNVGYYSTCKEICVYDVVVYIKACVLD